MPYKTASPPVLQKLATALGMSQGNFTALAAAFVATLVRPHWPPALTREGARSQSRAALRLATVEEPNVPAAFVETTSPADVRM